METLELAKYIPNDYDNYSDDNYNRYTVDEELSYIPIMQDNDEIPANMKPVVDEAKNEQNDKRVSSAIDDIFKNFVNTVNMVNADNNTMRRFSSSSKSVPSSKEFEKAYDEYEKINPESRRYRKFLTKVAYHESRFNKSAKNKNAPAYGYFQFMQDGKKYNNISAFAGTGINEYLNNPVLQISSAVKMIDSINRQLTQKDRYRLKELGISDEGAYGMAWLGGVGGLRRFIYDGVNASDSKWYKDKNQGVNMTTQLDRYN